MTPALSTTVRIAEVADLPRIEPCATEFYAKSAFLKTLKMDLFCEKWAAMIEAGMGVIFLLEVGGHVEGIFGGVQFPDLYSGELIATEFFWYVREGHRGAGMKLFRAFERWAVERHCTQIRMVHLMDSMPEKLERVYRGLGFIPAEIHYVKDLV